MIILLIRFYDVNSGAIKIDGHNIKDFNRSELRQMFGMVLQDTWLFSGSIEDNIRYGRLDATHEEVVEAAKAARAHRFIKTLPGGYQMELNEEASNVSQGQKQLLTIARAMLADPKHWQKHYVGTEKEIELKRKFSFSDRCRYYMPEKSVVEARDKMIENFKDGVPLNLLSQFMPIQYTKVREGRLENKPEALIIDRVCNTIDEYLYATHQSELY